LLDRTDQLDGCPGLMRARSYLAKLTLGAIAVSTIGVLVLPAVAHAHGDVAISQKASANVVEPGKEVTIDITVTGLGSVQSDAGDVNVDMLSTSGHGQPADNPYQSVKASQGSCKVISAEYQNANCSLGSVSPGQSVHIIAVITVNQSMNHLGYVVSEGSGEYADENRGNNNSAVTVYADKPPVVNGSKKLVLKGLPDGCFSEDFSLLIVAKAPDVKKVTFFALPIDEFGNGNGFTRKAKGSRLRVTVPVSKFVPSLGVQYDFKVKAKFRGRPPLKATVTFERC
jgi:Domain of unknown function DUF11